MKVLLSSVLLLLASTVFGQIKFEPGYLISSSGQKQECLIRNADWASNPSSIQYRLSESAPVQIANLENTEEFGIGSTYRYIRRNVLVDQSGDRLSNMSSNSEPDFREMQVFLRVWVSGGVSLYEYSSSEYTRFFYQKENGELVPLVFKRFREENRVGQNPKFRLQLFDSLNCGSTTIDDLLKVQYRASDLSRYFQQYNTCIGKPSTQFKGSGAKMDFNLSLRPRVSSATIDMNYVDFVNTKYKFKNAIMFEFGVEAELVLPLGRNKWSVTLEPGFFSIKQSKEDYRQNQDVWIEYKSFEIPVGLRRYFYLNEKNRIFVNALFCPSSAISSSMFFTSTQEAEVEAKPGVAVGAGIQVLNRIAAELRFNPSRRLTSFDRHWDTKFSRISLIAGFRLF